MSDTPQQFDTYDSVFGRLEADARKQPPGTFDMNKEVRCAEDLAEARRYVMHVIGEGVITQSRLARRVGAAPSAVSQFLTDKWNGKEGTLHTLATKLARACNQIVKQAQADESRIGGFVETHIAREIFSVVEYAEKRRMIGVVVLAAGAGKTMAADALHDDRPGSVLVTVTGARSGRKAFLVAWARALGLNDAGRAEDLQDSIADCLRGTDRLNLIDEAHKLQVAALDSIREVWDEAKVPILLTGTPVLRKSLVSRRVGTLQSEVLDQLYSRVGIMRDLSDVHSLSGDGGEKLFCREDIRRMFHRGKVRLSQDGTEYLWRFSKMLGSGTYRTCRDLVQIVVDLFEGQAVSAALLGEAYKLKFGTLECNFVAQVDETQTQPAAAAAG